MNDAIDKVYDDGWSYRLRCVCAVRMLLLLLMLLMLLLLLLPLTLSSVRQVKTLIDLCFVVRNVADRCITWLCTHV